MKMHLILFFVLLFAISGCAGANKAGENPVERMLDDSTITTRINHEMVKDEVVKARQIDVDTIGGHVTLTGVVATGEEFARAARIAHSVPAVKSVTNKLQGFRFRVSGVRNK